MSDVQYHAVRYTRGVGLHLGCGAAKAFPHMLGVDIPIGGERPDVTCDPSDPTALAAHFHPVPYVYSTMLGRIDDWRAALAAWWALVEPGGHLVIGVPETMLEDVRAALSPHAWNLHVQRTLDDRDVLLVFQKPLLAHDVPDHVYSHRTPRPEKSVCIVRHGGYGDQLQAAALFPEFKRKGFHVTVLTTPKGREVLEHDPHVDDWFLVDVDQVPNHELGPFWRAIARDYTRFVNLNESVEGVFLALPGRIQHTWPHALRHKLLNRNYAEHHADLAQLPFVAEGRFYETDAEAQATRIRIAAWSEAVNTPPASLNRAQRRALPNLAALGAPYLIVFALSGSAHHKFTPHQDAVIRAIVGRLTRALVLLVGDDACKILEAGLEDLPRVKCLSGELTIRETLALARQADLVIGPETGVLTSVAYEPAIKKVVLLSHSSPENLTRHWLNTTAIEGVAPCYPCHQLHYNSDACPRHPELGAAQCQVNVNPASIYHPIDADYTAWARVKLLHRAA